MEETHRVVMLGATGAVGSQAAKTLANNSLIDRLSLLGRRKLENQSGPAVEQHAVDIFAPDSYTTLLAGHDVAVCTLGVGQPSKVARTELVKVDKLAVIDFARACKDAGVRHFELLTSVSSRPASPLFYLRIKGELQDEIAAMGFERVSFFQPSMILTPTNRYGLSQAITLRFWPWLNPFLIGRLRKFRGIPVETLGRAMALNILQRKSGIETLHWDDFESIARMNVS